MCNRIAGVSVTVGFGLLLANLAMAADMATVDIRVVNDIGEPVSAALVYTSTPVNPDAPGSMSGQGQITETRHETNATGGHVYQGPLRGTYFGFTKEGHYASHSSYFSDSSPLFLRRENGRLILDVVLKRILNPVPMYALRTKTYFPASSGTFPYDLFAGDWAAPFGSGQHADFYIELSAGAAPDTPSCDLRFGHADDGIQVHLIPYHRLTDSTMRMPYEAPAEGYLPSLAVAHRLSRDSYQPARLGTHLMLPTWRQELNYFFRVRSGTQRPVFGKIHGPIRCTTDQGAPQLQMLYYVNPDGSGNIEFARNLFSRNDLKRIGAPRSSLVEVWQK